MLEISGVLGTAESQRRRDN